MLAALFLSSLTLAPGQSFQPRLPQHVRLHRIHIDPNLRTAEWRIEVPLCGNFPDGPKWVFTFPMPPGADGPRLNLNLTAER
jgi:hypothetical protein